MSQLYRAFQIELAPHTFWAVGSGGRRLSLSWRLRLLLRAELSRPGCCAKSSPKTRGLCGEANGEGSSRMLKPSARVCGWNWSWAAPARLSPPSSLREPGRESLLARPCRGAELERVP